MNPDTILAALRNQGFIRCEAADTRALLGHPPGWEDFAESWSGMPLDRHMADGGRYRRRRHAILSAAPGEAGLRREADGPHWQAVNYNPLNGGIDRYFAPMPPALTEGDAFQTIGAWARAAFDGAEPGRHWHIEAHQFRIEASPDQEGRPTPEGMHSDGVDWVLIMLMRRENLAEGRTQVASPEGEALGSFTLEKPGDAVLLDDRRVMHGVTPVRPLDPGKPSWRDVLVLTFRHR